MTTTLSSGVTLYIPCFNAERFLDCVLGAALSQTLPFAEILLIDDGSSDGSVTLARRLAAGAPRPLRVIEHGRNLGLGTARNTGVKEARTEFVASLDADVVAEPDWLERLMVEFDDPEVVGVGGELIEHYQRGMANRWRATHMRQSRGGKRVVNPPFLWGANNVFRRQALFDTGLYDERCRTNGEDVPVSRALRARNKTLVYAPSARCRHLRQDTLGSILDTYWRWRFYGNWNEISLYWTFKQNKGNFKYMPPIIRSDLVEGNWSNLLVDAALPFYRTARDWRVYLREGRIGPVTHDTGDGDGQRRAGERGTAPVGSTR